MTDSIVSFKNFLIEGSRDSKFNESFILLKYKELKKVLRRLKVVKDVEIETQDDQVVAGYITLSINKYDLTEDDDVTDKLVEFGFKQADTCENPQQMFMYCLAYVMKDRKYKTGQKTVEVGQLKSKTDFEFCEVHKSNNGQNVEFTLIFKTNDHYMKTVDKDY